MKVFRSDTRYRYRPTDRSPFKYFTEPYTVGVVYRNGHFVEVPVLDADEVAGLVEGVTWFDGGRPYLVDDDTAGLLVADGFSVTDPDGFGVGPFLDGFYGGGS